MKYKLYAIERVAGESPSYEGPLRMVFARIIFFRKNGEAYYGDVLLCALQKWR